MNKLKIAIFGSTSNIAKGLISNFLQSKEFSLHLYTRSPDEVCSFFDAIGRSPDDDSVIHEGYSDFMKSSYDVIINCVGVGTESKLRGDYTKYFTVTEEYDNLAIRYLCNDYHNTIYICLSSGAVYGKEFSKPADENTITNIQANNIATEDYYTIARLNSEAKHRAFKNLKIVDLRLFSYFSRFIDLTDGYFITEVMNCILNNRVFITDSVNIIRDYIHPEDLFLIIKRCIDLGKINQALDVISSRPVEKREILDYFSSEHGLEHRIDQSLNHTSATGSKNSYYSNYNSMSNIDYLSAYSSMDTIKQESKYILNIKHE